MIELKEGISKLLCKDNTHSYDILTYADLKIEFTDQTLREFLQKIVDKSPILKQHIVDKGTSFFLDDVESFDLSEHYKIINDTYENFDSYADTLINAEFTTKSKWLIYYIIDAEKKKYRLYFKIDHSYADGNRVIEMLMTPLKESDSSRIFKYKLAQLGILDTLYYLIIATITLFINFMGVLIEALSFTPPVIGPVKTEYIKCKPFKLSEIKRFAKCNGISVTAVLYSLMVKTDSLYKNTTDDRRDIIVSSPINLSKSLYLNNMAAVTNRISINLTNKELLEASNLLFNSYKHSLCKNICSFISSHLLTMLPLNLCSNVYNSLVYRCDYVFSNMVGPIHEDLEDIHFFIRAKGKEIIFNIISSNDNINVICSFKEGQIKDKARYEDCIYRAYNSLLRNNFSI